MAGAIWRRTHARMLMSVGAAAAAALLVGCTAAPPPAPTPTPLGPDSAGPIAAAAIEHLDATPCAPESVGEYAGQPTTGFLCGTLTVPLDHAQPGGPGLELDVILQGADAPRGVLLLLGGGPGGTARWLATLLSVLAPQVAAEYQLIAMDPRGTGGDALDCPMLQAEVGSSDLLAPSPDAVAECAAILGDRAGLQSTADTVADLEALRTTLGIDEWVLDGISYGTFVAQQYALAHPTATRALVLDSIVPLAGVDPFLLSSMRSTPGVLQTFCEWQDCAADPVADLEAVLAAGYPALPLLGAIVATSAIGADFTRLVESLALAAGGDTAELDATVAALEAMAQQEPISGFSAGAHLATLCADTPMPWGGADTEPATRSAELEAAVAELPAEATEPFPSSLAAEIGPVAGCLLWPTAAYRPPLVGELSGFPVLILAGELDLSTPATNARDAFDAMPDAELVIIPGAGHSVQTNPSGVAAAGEFLLSLDAR